MPLLQVISSLAHCKQSGRREIIRHHTESVHFEVKQ